jgi:hypothetical protein
MKVCLSLSVLIALCIFSASTYAAPIQDPVGYMLHEAKADQCEAKRSAAKVTKGVIDGLGEVVVVALPMEGCGGGNNWGTSIDAFYQGKAVSLGGAKGVESMSVKENQVIIKTMEQGEDDPDCCPSKHVTSMYSVQNGKLQLKK